MTQTQEERLATATPECVGDGAADAGQSSAATGSTLIEFPGARNVPPWRKELSERVREIQQRRAREAALESEETAQTQTDAVGDAEAPDNTAASHLGLVPPPPGAPEINPLVANALRRIERARHPAPTHAPRAVGGGGRRAAAAAAVARVAEERYEPRVKPQTAAATRPDKRAATAQEHATAPESKTHAEASHASGLIALPTQVSAKEEASTAAAESARAETDFKEAHASESRATAQAKKDERVSRSKSQTVGTAAAPSTLEEGKPAPRRVADAVIDDAWLSRLEEKILPPVNAATRTDDDIAPLVPRVAAGLLDLLIVAFISSPFAAVIELTNGDWADPRVAASMGGIVLTLMFLYLTVSTALAGRTVAMSIFRLHTVDAETALAPRLGQCARRTLVYMISLATFGLGVLYALFDAERRAAHDHLSGTVVVRE